MIFITHYTFQTQYTSARKLFIYTIIWSLLVEWYAYFTTLPLFRESNLPILNNLQIYCYIIVGLTFTAYLHISIITLNDVNNNYYFIFITVFLIWKERKKRRWKIKRARDWGGAMSWKLFLMNGSNALKELSIRIYRNIISFI